jgi:hypothetical protein
MTSLLTLEPRIVGDSTIEPDADFADLRDDLHGNSRCEPGTTTYYCVNTTRECYP